MKKHVIGWNQIQAISHLADYEWERDWGSYDMSDCATKTNVEAKPRRLTDRRTRSTTTIQHKQKKKHKKANIIRGNRIGPRFKHNLVNPETGVKVHSDFVDANINFTRWY